MKCAIGLSVLATGLGLVNGIDVTPRSWADARALATTITSYLTQAEKIGIVTGTGMFAGQCVGNTAPVSRAHTLPNGSTVQINIPSICMQDGPAGVRLVKNVTGFPTGINTASTFSRRLIRARGKALGEEFRGKGVHVFLGPAMDIARNPKAGRNWESAGPDPYLNGELAYYTIQGVQSSGVQACAKHLIANNQEHWRYGASSNVDDRTLQEIYFYPFLRSIEAGVASVMCAYNRFNGTSSCQNAGLLSDSGILHKAGFQGYVVSDWGATHDDAAVNANGGLDMEMPGSWIAIGGGVYGNNLANAVKDGKVTQARLDQMVVRILAPFYRLKQDDAAFPKTNFDSNKPDGSGSLNGRVNVRRAEHTALAREIAAASSVLLKNSKAVGSTRGLPLPAPGAAGLRSVAIIGQDAKPPKMDCNGLNECNTGTMSIGWGSGSNSLEFIVPPNVALKSHIGSAATITESLTNDINPAVAAARGKDVAFVFVNAASGELGFYSVVDGNMGDRNDLALWWKGGSLVEAVAAVNNNTIVVVHSVGPTVMTWTSHPNVTGVIYAGAPGEQTGWGAIDVLWGTYNPSGRLPFSTTDVGCCEKEITAEWGNDIVYNSGGFPEINYSEGLFIDYRWMDKQGIKTRFPFGFGLSYTTFSYSNLVIATSGTGRVITFTVQNSGSVRGTEIAQLYLGYPTSAGEPKRQLRGFEEVGPLAPGASANVRIELIERDFSIWSTSEQRYVRPSGTFNLWVGASIEDVRLSGNF